MATKKCSTCKIYKELSEYHNSTNAKDGKQSICKLCKLFKISNKNIVDAEELLIIAKFNEAKLELANYRANKKLNLAIKEQLSEAAIEDFNKALSAIAD